MGNTSATHIPDANKITLGTYSVDTIIKWDRKYTQLVIGTDITDKTELAYMGNPNALSFGLSVGENFMKNLIKTFPEFVFYIDHDYLYCNRLKYSGNISTCCISNTSFYVQNNSYLTCDPLTKKLATSNVCDGVMYDYCANKPINISACKMWFGGMRERGLNQDPNAWAIINHFFDISEASNEFEDFVLDKYHEWEINNSKFDEKLKKLAPNDRLKYLCSFPMQDVINMATEYTTPRVCWDKNCTNVTAGKMLTSDWVTRKNCTLSLCNASVNYYASSYKTYLDSSCTSKIQNQANLNSVLRTFNSSKLSVLSPSDLAILLVSFGLILSSLLSNDTLT
jgi:hypothetical protein